MSPHLLQPIAIGNLELRNRIVMAAMATRYADDEGYVTERLINHYVKRADGGAGLIITELTSVASTGKSFPNQLSIYKDDFIPGLRKLTRSVKASGAVKCMVQLHHGGRRAPSKLNHGTQPVAPSPIAYWGGEIPKELTSAEIEELIEDFARAAIRAKEAGFDGVELHCAHGYLLSQFLSPLTNKRTDLYGGSADGRARFVLEILKSIRRSVGQDYTVLAKICGDESIKGGLNILDAQKFTIALEEENISAIEVSGGYKASSEEGYLNASVPVANMPMSSPHGYFVPLAEQIKKVAKVPVIAIGRLDDPQLAEKTVAEGKADLISIARGLLADPLFPEKLARSQNGDIRPCIACNTCGDRLLGDKGLICAVNAEAGENDYQIKPGDKPKKILVVGGGPGGMEAARLAALRGHQVTLVEKKQRLGGNLLAASAVSFKKDIGSFIDYLIRQIQKLGIDVCLGYDFSEEKLDCFKPDAVILASGASPQMPAIPGIDRENATDAVKVMEGEIETGHNVVVVGGGMIGCEVAVFLAQKGRKVTLVTRRNSDFSLSGGLAPDMEATMRRWLLFELLPTLPVTVVANSTFREVKDNGLLVHDKEGRTRLIEGDTVVFATGMNSNNRLNMKLSSKVPELYQVGDCVQPRKIVDAIHEAARIGRLI